MSKIENTDSLIVGGGMSGLTVAQNNPQLTILETGNATDRRHKNTLSPKQQQNLWHRTETDSTFSRYWTSSRVPHFQRGSGVRERLGGRSLYWHGVCIPIEERALTSWPTDIATCLVAPSTTPGSYAEVTDHLNTWQSGTENFVDMRACRSEREAWLLELLKDAGYQAQPVPQVFRTIHGHGSTTQVPYSPLYDESGVTNTGRVITNCRVLDIRPRRGQLELVVLYEGALEKIEAGKVILSAGTIENTRLIGRYKMHATGSASETFSGLQDHIVQGFVASIPTGMWRIPTGPGRAFCYSEMLETADSNLFWEVLPSTDGKNERLTVWAMGEKLPGRASVIVPRSPWGEFVATRVRDPIDLNDQKVVAAQANALSEVATKLLGIAHGSLDLTVNQYLRGEPSWMNAISRLEEHSDPSQLAIYPYVYPLGSVDHESGTLPLGSTLSSHGTLPEDPRISVVGPATFPRSGAANPSLTTLALSRRFGLRQDTQ